MSTGQPSRRFWLLAATLGVALAPALPASSAASSRIRAITFANGLVDPSHAARLPGVELSMSRHGAFATFDNQGMTLHGLRCGAPSAAPVACHIFMAMQPFESRARFCVILPDAGPTPADWPQSIACPTVIGFHR